MHEEIYFILLQFFFYDSNDSYETLLVNFFIKCLLKRKLMQNGKNNSIKYFKYIFENYADIDAK